MSPDPEALRAWVLATGAALDARAGIRTRRSIAGGLLVEHRHLPGSVFAGLDDAFLAGPAEGPADLVVSTATTAELVALAVPPPPLADSDVDAHGIVPALEGTGVRLVRDAATAGLQVLDLESGTGVMVTMTAPADWEHAAPFRSFLHWTAAARGCLLVHAASVAQPGGRGALLLGPGGSGKSTTTLTAVAAGWVTAGDDYVLLDPTAPRVGARALYGTAKTKADAQVALPVLAGASRSWTTDDGSKHVHHLGEAHPHAFAAQVPVDVLVVMRRDGGSDVAPAAPSEALAAVAPSTIFQLPYDRATAFAVLGDLVRRVPAVTVTLHPDPDEMVRRLGRAVEVAA